MVLQVQQADVRIPGLPDVLALGAANGDNGAKATTVEGNGMQAVNTVTTDPLAGPWETKELAIFTHLISHWPERIWFTFLSRAQDIATVRADTQAGRYDYILPHIPAAPSWDTEADKLISAAYRRIREKGGCILEWERK